VGAGEAGRGGGERAAEPSHQAGTNAAVPRARRARPPAPAAGAGRTPFAWQHGSRLYLLEARPLGWIIAELRFDPDHCAYVEIRRTRYRWAREAAGAMLSHALAAGDGAAERAARDLDAWLIRQ